MIQYPRNDFSFYHNLHHPPVYYVNGLRYVNDYDIEEYLPQVKAFLTRRWTTKREVPAKIAIMEDMGSEFRGVYYQQRLAPGEINYTEKHLKRLYESDSINSQFLHSIFAEDYEKELLDEVS